MMPRQHIQAKCSQGTRSQNTLRDLGATFNHMKNEVAEKARWAKWPFVEKFITAGGTIKEMKMNVYQVPLLERNGNKVQVLAVGMDIVMQPLAVSL